MLGTTSTSLRGWRDGGGGAAFVDLENKGRRDWKGVCFVGRAAHFKPMPMQPTSPKLQPVEQLLVAFVFYVEFALLCGKFPLQHLHARITRSSQC